MIALIVTPEGVPLAYEVLAGNAADNTTLPDGTPAHSLRTPLEHLGTIVRNTCVTRSAKTPWPAFPVVTTTIQQQALQLLQRISMLPVRDHLMRVQSADSLENLCLSLGATSAQSTRRSGLGNRRAIRANSV